VEGGGGGLGAFFKLTWEKGTGGGGGGGGGCEALSLCSGEKPFCCMKPLVDIFLTVGDGDPASESELSSESISSKVCSEGTVDADAFLFNS